MIFSIHTVGGTGAADASTLEQILDVYFEFNVFSVPPTVVHSETDRRASILAEIRAHSPSDLSGYADDDNLPSQTMLHVPDARASRRPFFIERVPDGTTADGTGVRDALRENGVLDGRLFALRTPEHWFALLGIDPTDEQEPKVPILQEAHKIASMFLLPGMDIHTATNLAGTYSTLQAVYEACSGATDPLSPLVAAVPAATLDAVQGQRHPRRWWLSLIARFAGAPDTRKAAIFAIPYSPKVAATQAAFYERLASASDTPRRAGATPNLSGRNEAVQAAALGHVYRFVEHFIRGNTALLTWRHRDAVSAYEKARAEVHRFAEAVRDDGVPIDDDVGIALQPLVEDLKRYFDGANTNDPHPYGAPTVRHWSGRGRPELGFRSFVLSDLSSESPYDGLGSDVLASQADAPVHSFSHPARHALEQLLSGISGPDGGALLGDIGHPTVQSSAALADVRGERRAQLRAAIGALRFSEAATKDHGLTDAMKRSLSLAELPASVSAIGEMDEDLASNPGIIPASRGYPAGLLTKSGVKPTTKFLRLPPRQEDAEDVTVVVGSAFVADYLSDFLKPRFEARGSAPGATAGDLAMDESLFESASGIVAMLPILYAYVLPIGLGRAYLASGDLRRANERGCPGLPIWSSTSPDPVAFAEALTSTSVRDANAWAAVACALPNHLPGKQASLVNLRWRLRDGHRAYWEQHHDQADARYSEIIATVARQWPSVPELYDAGNDALTAYLERLAAIAEPNDDGYAVREPVHTGLNFVVDSDAVFAQLGDVRGPLDPGGVEVPGGAIEQQSPPAGTVAIEWLESYAVGQDEDRIERAVSNSASASELLDVFLIYRDARGRRDMLRGGMDWFGYGSADFPPWSFEVLLQQAQALCDRVIDAERQMLSLFGMLDAGEQQQLEVDAAQSRADQAMKGAEERLDEANERLKEVQRRMSASDVGSILTTATSTADAVQGLAQAAKAAGAAGLGAALASNPVGWAVAGTMAVSAIFNAVKTVQANAAARLAAEASVRAAVSDRDAAALERTLADDMEEFLQAKRLNSAMLQGLLEISAALRERFLQDANHVAWLAQKALRAETKLPARSVRGHYAQAEGVAQLTAGQQLLADVLALRTLKTLARRNAPQSIKVTLPLSSLSPSAWQSLRSAGRCAFSIPLRRIDALFPGTYLHRIADVQVAFVGRLPATGVRGTLSHMGYSETRVPADFHYPQGALVSDWPATTLKAAQRP